MKKIKLIIVVLLAAFISTSAFNPYKGKRYSEMEQPIKVEEWMTTPFDTTVAYEEPIEIEDWMTKPFKIN